MGVDDLSSVSLDEHEIVNLLFRWGHARDSDDWETFTQCFHDDATIHLSWISGPASDFVARSRGMATDRKPGQHIKHMMAAPWIRVNGDRAFSRCHANLYMRIIIDGHELDLQSWIRFFDLLEKRNRVWGIVKRVAVYEKDRLDPVDPYGIPEDFFADMDLSGFPASAKFLCYSLRLMGLTPSPDIISVYTREEQRLRSEGETWIS